MVTDGAFNPAARAAIYTAGLDRCAGCGRPDLSAQHRRGRGMGGTSDVTIGHPANGVPLCGGALAGVMGCHGWAERHPLDAELLGWRLSPGTPALGAPWYCHPWQGWRAWVEVDGMPHTAYVDVDELDRLDERLEALARMRLARPLPKPPRLMAPKPTR